MKTDGRALLHELLGAEDEETLVKILKNRKLFDDESVWRELGDHGNNASVVMNQQSTPMPALVEKVTNSIDAILLRHVQEKGINPRDKKKAPASMMKAVELTFGEVSTLKHLDPKIRQLGEDNLILYATGSKARPSLSLYDAGEGQLAKDFPTTFCSLLYGGKSTSGSGKGSYKGAIPFVQGRFNMGGTGVLPFCGEKYHFQLIVSRRAPGVIGSDKHEWAFTLFRYFPSPDSSGWKYLVVGNANHEEVAKRGAVWTAGKEPLALLPAKAKEDVMPKARAREVPFGTLIKMYEFDTPRSNICGELYKKLEDYLIQPALPLRIIECRTDYKAKVFGVNLWDRLAKWDSDKLEEGFEDNEGASFSITLTSNETVSGSVRVFKLVNGKDDHEVPTGLRAMINGQSHGKKDVSFFRTKAVDKEHIAGSMLVTLDCTNLGQPSRQELFMADRERFRDTRLLHELLAKIQAELKSHEKLIELNEARYKQKLENATTDEAGINALEELLVTDKELAQLFGTLMTGKVAAPTATAGKYGKVVTTVPGKFVGLPYPTYFKTREGGRILEFDIPQGRTSRPSVLTDVQDDYFNRRKHKGSWKETGQKMVQAISLWKGRLSFTCAADKNIPIGTYLQSEIEIKDRAGSGPFKLKLRGTVVEAPEKVDKPPKVPRSPPEPKADAVPSRPNVKEVPKNPEDPPITIQRDPQTQRLELVLNTNSNLLTAAKAMRKEAEHKAVEFVFKYGLALVVMGQLDRARTTEDWRTDEPAVRARIEEEARGVARVIVPLCLVLPQKLPQAEG